MEIKNYNGSIKSISQNYKVYVTNKVLGTKAFATVGNKKAARMLAMVLTEVYGDIVEITCGDKVYDFKKDIEKRISKGYNDFTTYSGYMDQLARELHRDTIIKAMNK